MTNALPTQGFVAGPELAFYPCGSALFQYFHCVMTGYTEGQAYVAHNMLLVAVAAVAVPAGRGWRHGLIGAVAATIILLASFAVVGAPFPTWPISMRTLYLDAPLGGFMGAAVGWYFIRRGARTAALKQVAAGAAGSSVVQALRMAVHRVRGCLPCSCQHPGAGSRPVGCRAANRHAIRFRRGLRRHLVACVLVAVAAPIAFQVWLLVAPQSEALAERTKGVSLSGMLHSIRHERPVLASRLHEFSGALTHTQINTWTTLAPLALLQAAKLVPDTAEPAKFEVRLPAMCLVLSVIFAVSVLIFSAKEAAGAAGRCPGLRDGTGVLCVHSLLVPGVLVCQTCLGAKGCRFILTTGIGRATCFRWWWCRRLCFRQRRSARGGCVHA